MNAKKAKAIRRAMREQKDAPTQYGLTGTPHYNQDKKFLRYSITYHVIGQDRLEKTGKFIYKKYGVLPNA